MRLVFSLAPFQLQFAVSLSLFLVFPFSSQLLLAVFPFLSLLVGIMPSLFSDNLAFSRSSSNTRSFFSPAVLSVSQLLLPA